MQISKLTTILATLVAGFGVSALVSTSASAACGGGAGEWCMNGNPMKAGEGKIAEEATVTKNFVLEAPTIGVKFECRTLKGKGVELLVPNRAKAETLIFGECKNVGTPTCELVGNEVRTNPIRVEEVKKLGGLEVEATFEPEEKLGAFAAIKLGGKKCSVAGANAIKGKARITGPKGQEEREMQPIVANTGAKELEIGNAEAKLTGEAELLLEAKTDWSFR